MRIWTLSSGGMIKWTILLCYIYRFTSCQKCNKPVVDNGSIFPDSIITASTVITVKCGRNYRLSGADRLTCQKDGTFYPTLPKCQPQQCTKPDIINGNVNNVYLNPGDLLDITCDENYQKSTDQPVTCVTKDVFNPVNIPSCQVDTCIAPNVRNGKITSSHLSPGIEVLIECLGGYEKNESVTVTCISRNMFSVSSFDDICYSVPCDIPHMSNGKVITSSSKLPIGSPLTVICNTSYTLTSTRPVYCESGYKFSSQDRMFVSTELPACRAKPCSDITIPHGSVSQPVEPGNALRISCEDGYHLDMDTPVTCVAHQIYNLDLPSCVASNCKRPSIDNGEVLPNTLLAPGARIRVKCGTDYRLDGPEVLECVRGELFNDVLPQCKPVPCPTPSITHGRVITQSDTLVPGQVLSIDCDSSYGLGYGKLVRCITNNTFHPVLIPSCVRVNCDKPEISHGQVTSADVITPDRTLTIQCDSGYELSHNRNVTCFSKHEYSTEVPNCRATPCKKPSFISHGVIVGPDIISPGRVVTVRCDENYELRGSRTVQCVTSSEFSPVHWPTCAARACPVPAVPHGYTKSTVEPGERVKVQCNEGYDTVDGSYVCVSYRLFEGLPPSCNARRCVVSSIKHSSFISSPLSPGTALRVQCDENYRLSNDRRVLCVTDTQFSAQIPTCQPKNCQKPYIKNGILRDRDLSPGQNLQIGCDEGFVMSHTNQVRCVAGINFSPKLPECRAVQCTLPHLTNGEVTGSEPGSIVTVKCSEGYRISHTQSVHCVSGSVFRRSDNWPTCDAMPCSTSMLPHGHVTNPGTLYPGDIVQFVCDPDYTLSTTTTVSCVTGDKFSINQLPQCNDKDCSLPWLGHGKVTSPHHPVTPGTRVSVVCDQGYDLQGPSNMECLRANTFSPAFSATCRARRCPLPSSLSHGRYLSSSMAPGEVIQLSCDENYSSNSVITACVTSNQFTVNTFPACIPDPCPAPHIPHGTALGPISPGGTLTVECETGFLLSHGSIVKCVAGSMFSGVVPQCKAQACTLPSIPHGSLPSSTISPGEEVNVRCEEDYILSHNQRVTCVTLDKFSADVPRCIAQPCILPTISFGSWYSSSPLLPGASSQLRCDHGYTAVGEQIVKCKSGRIFEPRITCSCVENCRSPKVPNGYTTPSLPSLPPGSTVTVQCNEGYTQSSLQVLTCVSGAQFNPRDVWGCQASPCTVPEIHHGTAPTTLSPGSTLSIDCEAGYSLTGTPVQCITEGQLTGDIPRCRPQPCPRPTLRNAVVENSDILQPKEQLRYRCLEGYYNNNVENVFCVTLGYSADLPNCSPINCPAPTILHGMVEGETEPGEVLNITCNTGLVLSHSENVRCITAMQYSIELPTCIATPCSTPTIENGLVISSQPTQPGGILSVRCNSGYRLVQNKPLICVSTILFTTDIPHCEPIPCEKPVVENGIVKALGPILPGDTVVVECARNYKISGSRELQCVSNNTFSMQSSCHPIPCTRPTVPHGRLSGTGPITPGSAMTLDCDAGYEPDCPIPITCISADNFDPIVLPRCLPQECKVPSIQGGVVTGPRPLTPGSDLIIQCRSGRTLSRVTPTACVTLEQYDPPVLPVCVLVRNCSVPHLAGGKLISPPTALEPGQSLSFTCETPLVPSHGNSTVTCLSGVYFNPAPPACTSYEVANSNMKNNKKIHKKPAPAPNSNKSLIVVIVAMVLLFILALCIFMWVLWKCKMKNQKLKSKAKELKTAGGHQQLSTKAKSKDIHITIDPEKAPKPITKPKVQKVAPPRPPPVHSTRKKSATSPKLPPNSPKPIIKPKPKPVEKVPKQRDKSSASISITSVRSCQSADPTEKLLSKSEKLYPDINYKPVQVTDIDNKNLKKEGIYGSDIFTDLGDISKHTDQEYDLLLEELGLSKNDFQLDIKPGRRRRKR